MRKKQMLKFKTITSEVSIHLLKTKRKGEEDDNYRISDEIYEQRERERQIKSGAGGGWNGRVVALTEG